VVSRTGTLVYSDVPSTRLQLLWCDRSGKTLSTIGDPQPQQSPALSPDGRRLAIASRESGAADIWLYELDREIKTKTRIGAVALVPGQSVWTPAGDEITYVSNAAGNADVVSKPSTGNGEAILLAGTPLDEQAPDWSPGRKFLIYTMRSSETKADVLYRERRQDGTLGSPQVFLKTAFNEGLPRFSPDGRFVLYMSDESGKNEIYVRDFPAGKNKWQISTNGGVVPRWRRDGKEIFYIEGAKLMAASVTTQPAFSPHAPARLFENRQLAQSGYDVSRDGKRFVVLERPSGEPPLSVHVVHNWFEEFRGK
jgi:eukaryotic-like serine/threonine-protein kinase